MTVRERVSRGLLWLGAVGYLLLVIYTASCYSSAWT